MKSPDSVSSRVRKVVVIRKNSTPISNNLNHDTTTNSNVINIKSPPSVN